MLSAYSQSALSLFYPLPNYGSPGAIASNYLANFSIPINSNQADFRVDQTLGSKNLVFARFTYKNRRVFQVPPSGFYVDSPPTSPALGSNAVPEVDEALSVAWNYTISPSIINEVCAGVGESRTASTFGITAQESYNELGLTGLQAPPAGVDIVPGISIAGFTGYNVFNSTGGRADTLPGINPYEGQSINQWINPAAFTNPGNAAAIGRFGDASSGNVVGPGTQAIAISLIKGIQVKESVRLQVGAQVANLFNHPSVSPPANLTVGVAGFGQITSLQTAEGAGPRATQLTAH